jgi:hypothetical protein
MDQVVYLKWRSTIGKDQMNIVIMADDQDIVLPWTDLDGLVQVVR